MLWFWHSRNNRHPWPAAMSRDVVFRYVVSRHVKSPNSKLNTHWTVASWMCTPWGRWSPWVVGAAGWWSSVAGGWAARRPSGWSDRPRPGPPRPEPRRRRPGPPGPGRPLERVPRVGQRSREGGAGPAGAEAAAGGEDWPRRLKESLTQRKEGGGVKGGVWMREWENSDSKRGGQKKKKHPVILNEGAIWKQWAVIKWKTRKTLKTTRTNGINSNLPLLWCGPQYAEKCVCTACLLHDILMWVSVSKVRF